MPRMQNHTQFRNPFVNFIDEFFTQRTQGSDTGGTEAWSSLSFPL